MWSYNLLFGRKRLLGLSERTICIHFADARYSTNKRIHLGLNYDLGTSTARKPLISELYIYEEDTLAAVAAHIGLEFRPRHQKISKTDLISR